MINKKNIKTFKKTKKAKNNKYKKILIKIQTQKIILIVNN